MSISSINILKGNASIEVSADTLKSLLTSVENLRRDVYQLQQDKVNMESELKRLQERCGVTFRRFSGLPPEIRRMIWKEALMEPQILVLSETKISRSQVNFVMQTCREARDVGLSLRLPYFQVSPNGTWLPEDPKFYFKLDADTLWLDEYSRIPRFIQFFCGVCERGSLFTMIPRGIAECTHNLRPKRLAVNYKTWQDPTSGEFLDENDEGTTDVLRHFNSVKELYIVVGDTTTSKERDVYFQTPKRTPYMELEFDDLTSEHMELSWSEAESNLEEAFKILKQTRADERKAEREDNGASEEELDQMFLTDISSWDPPKVRYVEAFPAQKWWIRPQDQFKLRVTGRALSF
ncbi:hypothetical protein ONS95_002694 [Cadophora gregata]|uniref:uncharacterized protein n=1 Tax=Cadophora gregata TaxID=51156 RepID=UPI0026DB34D0|nr:uncharacterized protein ONS95_002694 [Cadophora gregata]KAK0110034.1 hypothetical protein ONS95_002694 [Cadophora gregata]KAK0110344.1 hypothetical protein ONS96_001960 [Cadophora gregata f. sp. sojae]